MSVLLMSVFGVLRLHYGRHAGGRGAPPVPCIWSPGNQIGHKHTSGEIPTVPPFCPPRAAPTPRPGQVPFGRGLWPPKRHDPGPTFYVWNPQVQQRPNPHTHLKLISDLGPWGYTIPRNTHSLSPPLLPPLELFPSSHPYATCYPPRPPNMPLHCSRVGRQAAAGPLDRGTLTQAMHAALAGAWGGQAPWPTGLGGGGACWLKEQGSCCQAAGPAPPPGPHPRIHSGTRGLVLCLLQLIHEKLRDDL